MDKYKFRLIGDIVFITAMAFIMTLSFKNSGIIIFLTNGLVLGVIYFYGFRCAQVKEECKPIKRTFNTVPANFHFVCMKCHRGNITHTIIGFKDDTVKQRLYCKDCHNRYEW